MFSRRTLVAAFLRWFAGLCEVAESVHVLPGRVKGLDERLQGFCQV